MLSETVMRIPAPASAYEAHQAVWKIVGGDPRRRDFLFKVCPSKLPGQALLKIRSKSVAGMPVRLPRAGGQYRFSLLINPVRRSKDGQRPIVRGSEVQQWLAERLEKNGMKLIDCRLEFLPSLEFGKKGHPCRVHAVEAFGTLSVENEELAAITMAAGIGRSRSMGFGLMEIEEVA